MRSVAQYPSLDFDQLLVQTGAGMKCTACRLDLESVYMDVYDSAVRLKLDSTTTSSHPTAAQMGGGFRSLSRKILRFFDRHAPPFPFLLRDFSPVLAGNGVSQYVLIANDSLRLSNSQTCAPLDGFVVLRNDEGRVLLREKQRIEPEGAMQIELSAYLEKDFLERGHAQGTENIWGSVEVQRRWEKPALRGTTRPQLVINARKGTGGVHTQGPSGSRTDWYTVLARPEHERSFVTVVNAHGGRLKVKVNCPLDPASREFTLPGYGCRGVEVDTRSVVDKGLSSLAVSISCDGPSKTHVWTASPEMDRVAVDHPAES